MDSLIYLDNAATTAVKPEVFEQMMPYFMDTYSNPASVYSFAGKAKKAVDDAREQIANALNATTDQLLAHEFSHPEEIYLKEIAERIEKYPVSKRILACEGFNTYLDSLEKFSKS